VYSGATEPCAVFGGNSRASQRRDGDLGEHHRLGEALAADDDGLGRIGDRARRTEEGGDDRDDKGDRSVAHATRRAHDVASLA
jgi:hypothetical protein